MPTRRKLNPRQAFLMAAALRQGMTMADLHAAARVHASVFYRWARGECTSARLDRLAARKLDFPVRQLRSLPNVI